MAQTAAEHVAATISTGSIVVMLNKKIDRIIEAHRRPDPLRFKMVVMNQILTKFICERSKIQIPPLPEKYLMEDSPAADAFFEEVVKEFAARGMGFQEQRSTYFRLLNSLFESVMPQVQLRS